MFEFFLDVYMLLLALVLVVFIIVLSVMLTPWFWLAMLPALVAVGMGVAAVFDL